MTAAAARRRLGALAALGLAALLSLLLIPVGALVPQLAAVPGGRALVLVQPGVLLALALWAGHRLSVPGGGGAPMLDALLAGARPARAGAAVLAAGASALAAALLLVAYTRWSASFFAAADGPVARLAAIELPLLTRILWGGIGEELLMRWGAMTALLWLGWRLAGRPPRPGATVVGGAILLSALLFALGHLPVLLAIMGDPPPLLLAAVIAGNWLPGLLFGWLYWRHGLEAAMLAHGGSHLLAAFGSQLG